MKITKIISLLLILATLSFCFIACDGGETNAEEATSGETATSSNISVSFKIKDKDGKIIEDVVDYTYIGKDPTVLGIIDFYLTIEEDYEVVIDDDNVLQSIDEYAAGDADDGKTYYWAFMMGTAGNSDIVDKKMSEYEIKDGEGFTVILTELGN